MVLGEQRELPLFKGSLVSIKRVNPSSRLVQCAR